VIIVPLAVVAAIVIGVVIAFAVKGDDKKDTVTGPTPAVTTLPTSIPTSIPSLPTSIPTLPGALEPTGGPSGVAGCVPVGPAAPSAAGVAAIGQTVQVVGRATSSVSTYTVKVTLNSVCTTRGKVQDYGSLPKNGVYYVNDVTVEVVSGDPPSAFYTDFNVVTPDGRHYTGSRGPDPVLNAINTQVGQKYRGNVAVDAPLGHNVFAWEPLFASVPARFQY
jgi:hypothetical protein